MPSRDIGEFIARWSTASPSERANAQLFLVELCDLLGVPRPDPKPGSGYAFEFPVTSLGSSAPARRQAVPLQPGHAQRNRREAKIAEKKAMGRACEAITFQGQILKRLRLVRLCALRASAV